MLVNSLGDSVHEFINDVQTNALQIPAPRDSVAEWPLIGAKLHAAWSRAHTDLPALVSSLQPKIGDLAKSALSFVAAIGGGLLMLLAAFIIAGIIMAFGQGGERGTGAAVAYSVLLFVAGMTDNVLKPLMLGRGVDAPMPVILLGALGGMATAGILGMFVGATLLALGYQIFMSWVASRPHAEGAAAQVEPPS